MAMFLTPDAPVLRRHLLPPDTRRHGLASLPPSVLAAIQDAWKTRRDEVESERDPTRGGIVRGPRRAPDATEPR